MWRKPLATDGRGFTILTARETNSIGYELELCIYESPRSHTITNLRVMSCL